MDGNAVRLPRLTKQRRAELLKVADVVSFCRAVGVRSGQGLAKHFAEPADAAAFFATDGPYERIVKLAFKLPRLVQELPLLPAYADASVSLTQLQCASLLANGFLCLFPPPSSRKYGSINMGQIFEGRNIEKLRCILHYFRRVTDNDFTPDGVVRFHRRYLRVMPSWDDNETVLVGSADQVRLEANVTIEDASPTEWVHADFANKVLGGGVLGHGLVQEEIRFLICPELIVGRLVCQELTDQETVEVAGTERFSDYEGYGYDKFLWAGDHQDTTPFDGVMRCSRLMAFDAQSYKAAATHLQFSRPAFLREANKAYVAFFAAAPDHRGVATGNWGAGVFLGDPRLKFLLQLMAAAVAGHRRLLYTTWGDEELAVELRKMLDTLLALRMTVGELMRALGSFNARGRIPLFDHVLACATQPPECSATQ